MFEQVVFAGGGHRCWWQAGFWDMVVEPLALRPRVIAGVSAGAATACLLYANDSRTALDYYRHALAGNRRNANWANLLRPGVPVFPHAGIYRRALHALLGGEHFRRLQREAPEIRVQFSRLPRGLGPRSAVGLGLIGYNVEKYWRRPLHPSFGRWLGFRPEVVRVQECRDDEDLVSLIIASSCTPPFTPIERRGGRPTLDGGLVDNVPVEAVDPEGGPTLVLVTRRYPRRPAWFRHAGRLYVQPSDKVPVASWDYTSPQRYELAYALGRRDGAAFLNAIDRKEIR